jgi:hypothetical protein
MCLLAILAASGTACHKDSPPDPLLTAKAVNSCVEITEVREGYSLTYTIRELFPQTVAATDSTAVTRQRESVARSQGHEFGIVYRPRPRTSNADTVRRVVQVSRPVVAVADAWADADRMTRPEPTTRARLIRRCRDETAPGGITRTR